MLTDHPSHTVVMKNVLCTVDAINRLEELNIEYLADHTIQLSIAGGIESVSSVSFSNCVVGINGLLIQIHKPSEELAKRLESGENILLRDKKEF